MAIALDFEKLNSGGVIRWDFHPAGSFANVYWPTATELNAGQPLSQSLDLSDTDFNVQASNTSSDPTFADVGNVETRGAEQYGGTLALLFPQENDDNSNAHSVVQDTMQKQRLVGYISRRIDGDKPWDQAYAAGDYVSIFYIITDGETLSIVGEESYKYGIGARPYGLMAVYTVVGTTSTPVLALSTSTVSGGVGDAGRVTATVNGREWSNGLNWASSAGNVASVRKGGVWKGLGVGSATLTASVPHSNVSDTVTATIS